MLEGLILKKPLTRLIGTSIIALGIASSTPAMAASVTFNFSGVITSASTGVFSPSIQTGAPIRGFYTFDPTTPNLYPNSEMIGVYETSRPTYGLEVSFGSDTFRASSFTTTIYNLNVGAYVVSADINVGDANKLLSNFSLELSEPADYSSFTTALPITPPNINSFVGKNISFYYAYNPNDYSSAGEIHGTLDSLTAAPVPEPSSVIGSIALVTLGTAGYVLKRRQNTPPV